MYFIPNNQETISAISLSEFCRKCEAYGRISTIDDYKQLAPLLRALAANETLLNDFYLMELKDIEAFKNKQSLSGQNLNLANLKNCDIRMVFWPKKSSNDSISTLKAFSYTIPHDHNFHFMSIGYSGPGYLTNMYTYNHKKVSGCVGERIDITTLGTYNVSKGDIMIYEESRDIHTQIPPNDFSITINIIPKQRFRNYQYYFNLETNTISEVVQESSQLKYLEKLAKQIGTSDILRSYEQLLLASEKL